MVRRRAQPLTAQTTAKRRARASGGPAGARARSANGARWGALVVASVLLVACAAQDTTLDEHPCPPEGTTLTYDNFGKGFLDRYCQVCHGKPTADRNGAPTDVTFRNVDDVARWRERIFARAAADNTTMPPGPDDPPADERADLADWLACGAK